MSVEIDGVNNIIKADTISEVTSANGVAVDGVTLKDGGVAATTASTITTADNSTNLSLVSTDADANTGPVLDFYRNSSSPADVDFLANITFRGKNDAGQDVQYVEIENYALDVSDGSEDGYLGFSVITAGANPSYFEMRGGEGSVFNQGSNDIDFRVESNGNTHQLFVDGGNDRVHINGSTGTRELNVSGDNTRLLLYSTNNSTGAGQLQFGDADNEQIGRIMYEHDGNKMTFHTNDSEKMRIDSAGKVGIGETTPLGTLHVKSGDTGATAQGDANELIIEQNGASGLSILSANNAAGNIFFGDAQDNDVGRIIYNHNNNNMSFRANATEFLRSDEDGHVTMPKQPCVLAYSSSAQNDIATGVVKINLDAEVYDVNADFNTSNATFTAPVTGKYMCCGNITMSDVDTAFQFIYGRFNTSNRIYYMSLIDPRIEMSADGLHTWTFSALVDMDANDTLVMDTRSSAHGAAQNNIVAGTATAPETFMTVYLAA